MSRRNRIASAEPRLLPGGLTPREAQVTVDAALAKVRKLDAAYHRALEEYKSGLRDLNAVRREERATHAARSELRELESLYGIEGRVLAPNPSTKGKIRTRGRRGNLFGVKRVLPGSIESGRRR